MGNFTSELVKCEMVMALANSTAAQASAPGAISSSPLRMARARLVPIADLLMSG